MEETEVQELQEKGGPSQIINLRWEVRHGRKEAFKAGQLIIRKNLWFLDGSRELNGDTLLNAGEYKEEI